MFDELLQKLDETIKDARNTARETDRQIKDTMMEFGVDNQVRQFHDPTHTYGKTHSFSRSQRFKALQKQELKTTDSFYQPAQINKEKKGVKFGNSSRFEKQKTDQLSIINPKYDVAKPNNQKAPIYKPVPEDKLEKSRASIFTAASDTDVSPAQYFINQSQQRLSNKNCGFSKQKRFIQEKQKYQGIPLYINENQTRKRPPSAAILKPKTKKPQNLISRQKQEQLRERLKQVYWRSIPLELDRLLNKNVNGPIMREKYFNIQTMKGTERRCAIMMLLERMNFERGGLDINTSKNIGQNVPCGVAYRKSTPKPFKFSQMQPGPDYYYPLDDITRPNIIGFSFGKQEQKKQTIDHRDYEIQEQIFKKGGNIIINPEHKAHRLTQEQIRDLNRGPGYYDSLFKQVQKRNDIGVVKFQELNQKNARENNCVDIKEINDAPYFVKYDAIDPNKPAPLYKDLANVKPMHMPDKQLFPEHWLFYDGDLRKVRAEIAKNVLLAKGMSFQEYKKYATKFRAFKKYLEDGRRMPEGLEYDVKYDQLDPHIQGFEMQKQQEKTLIEPITKDQFGMDGDNLILEPEKLKNKLPDLNFKNMIGRDEQVNDPDEIKQGDRLLLNPQKMEKHIQEIDFKKQVDRPPLVQEKHGEDESPDGDVLLLNPKLPENKLANIDFKKQSDRPEIKNRVEDDTPGENIINPIKPKRINGFVQMERMTSVRLVSYLKIKKKQQMTEEERDK